MLVIVLMYFSPPLSLSFTLYDIRNCEEATHKSISPALSCLPVCDHHRLIDVPELVEVFSQTLVGGVVGQSPHEDFGERGILLGDAQRRGGGCTGHDCRSRRSV